MLKFIKKILKKNYVIYFISLFLFQKVFLTPYSRTLNLIKFLINYKNNKNFKMYPKEIGSMILHEEEFYYPKHSIVYNNFLKKLEKKKILYTEYELITKKFFEEKVDCIIDVGANIGYLSLFYYKFFGNKITIHSFEPHPISFFFLKKNLSTYDNITLYNFALGDENKSDFMSIPNHETQRLSNLGLMSIGQHSSYFKTKILIKKFDLLNLSFKKFKSIYIKIDVEGYEDNVLKGMFNFLSSNLKIYLKIEISKHFNNLKKITSKIELLEKCNYNFFIIKDKKFTLLNKHEIIKFLIYRNADIFCKKKKL